MLPTKFKFELARFGFVFDRRIPRVVLDMISIRPAAENDFADLCSIDLIARRENERREFIRREIVFGNCFVAVMNETVIGYGILNYTFYYNGCIDMLYIDSDYRRIGAGAALLQHLESLCQTPKLFTSTNLSNLSMQSLLAKMNYVLSGVIHNLDENDPEIVYFKRLR
jgi:GNAT superfamily N-acetyltransferase